VSFDTDRLTAFCSLFFFQNFFIKVGPILVTTLTEQLQY
jgi:hypothetical protein